MMAERPSKLDQAPALREAHLSAVENAKAAAESKSFATKKPLRSRNFERDE